MLELENLVGQHVLSGAQHVIVTINGENTNGAIFTLDGIHYKVTDLLSTTITELSDVEPTPLETPINVIGEMVNVGKDDMIHFTDVNTGDKVLELGTMSLTFVPYCILNVNVAA